MRAHFSPKPRLNVLLSADLSAFDGFNTRLMLVAGAVVTMQVAIAPLAAPAQWQHSVPPCGGFIHRLDKQQTSHPE